MVKMNCAALVDMGRRHYPCPVRRRVGSNAELAGTRRIGRRGRRPVPADPRAERVARRRDVRAVPGRPVVGQRELAGVLRRLQRDIAAPAAGAGRQRRPRRRRPRPRPSRRRRGRGGRSREPAPATARRRRRCAAPPPGSSPTWRPASTSRPPPASARSRPSSSRSTARSSTATWAAPVAGRSASPTSSATPSCGPSPTTSPVMNRTFVTGDDGKPAVVTNPDVNLGLAVDQEKSDGSRTLLVPVIKGADKLDFRAFSGPTRTSSARSARTSSAPTTSPAPPSPSRTRAPSAPSSRCPGSCRARASSSASAASTTRPPTSGADPATLADLGVSKVVTVTSTYDHRIIQGAESGLFLQKVQDLLLGGDGFYDSVFRALGVPYEAVQWRRDVNPVDREEAMLAKQVAVDTLIRVHRVRGHLIADLDPLAWKEPEMEPELDPATYGLTIWDLDREFLTGGLGGTSTERRSARSSTCCATPTAARSASSTCTSRSSTSSAGSRSRSRACRHELDARRQAPHPRQAQRGRGVRDVPRHEVRRPEALRPPGRRVGDPDPRRRARGGGRRTTSTASSWACRTAAASTCSPTSSARATTRSSRSSRAASTPSRRRARAT